MNIFYFYILDCNLANDGSKRRNSKIINFHFYEICKDGIWQQAECERGSLFWSLLSCCIPISKYPSSKACTWYQQLLQWNKIGDFSLTRHSLSYGNRESQLQFYISKYPTFLYSSRLDFYFRVIINWCLRNFMSGVYVIWNWH